MSHGKVLPEIKGMSSLKVDNLAFKTTANDLRRAFEKHGEIGDVYLPRDRLTRKSRGYAFVRYNDLHDAEVVMKAMNGKCLDGRELRVQMAQHDRPETPLLNQKRSRSISPSKSLSGKKSKSCSPKRRTPFSSEKKVPVIENGMTDVKKEKKKRVVQTDKKKKISRSKLRSGSKSKSSSKPGSLL